MNTRKRRNEGINTNNWKRSRSGCSYSSDSDSEGENNQSFVNKVSGYIKNTLLQNTFVQHISGMFGEKSTDADLEKYRNKDGNSNGNCDEFNHRDKSLSMPQNGNERHTLNSSKTSTGLISQTHHERKYVPLSFSSGNPFIRRSQLIHKSWKSNKAFLMGEDSSDNDIIILPVPVIESTKSTKKIFKSSAKNFFVRNSYNDLQKSKKNSTRVNRSSRYNCTAIETIRLAEREKYKQLLRQYTSMQAPTVTSRSSSSSSICEISNQHTKQKGAVDLPILIKSKLGYDISRQLSLRLQSQDRSTLYSDKTTTINKAPIIIDLEDSSSKASSSSVECLSNDNEELPTAKHSSITTPHKMVLKDKAKQYPFFTKEWTENLKKELEEMSSDIKPLIEIAKIETETYKKERDEREANLIERRWKELRKSKLTYSEIEKEDEEEKGFVELTEEMECVIDEALIPTPPDELLIEAFSITIRRKDIETLSKLNWLNDEVINFYFNLLVDRGKSDDMPSVYTFNTFFYPRLINSGHSGLKRWTRKVDIFSYHFIIIPIHLGMHWCLAIINLKSKEISYYDSLGNNNSECHKALRQYLCDESLDKRKKSLDISSWSSNTPKDIPQQMNGSDCGMFSCIYAEYITREAKITFTQEDMPYFRRRMVYEILTKELL